MADFLTDRRTQNAVVMSLLVIGEVAARVAEHHPDKVSQYPEVPWKSMRGMRNRIAHGYFDIDLGVVWQTASVAIPELLVTISTILDREGGSDACWQQAALFMAGGRRQTAKRALEKLAGMCLIPLSPHVPFSVVFARPGIEATY